jgi:16S rRNA (uracil1498-N3)-methyltransferase
MRVPRVRLPDRPEGPELDLPPAEARHLVRVLRRGPGDRVELLLGSGGAIEAEIVALGDKGGEPWVRVRIAVGATPRAPATFVPWTVGLALVKGEAFDLAVRMAAELGLARIVPLVTERGLPPPRGGGSKEERWQRIAREAAKQCGRTEPLLVDRCQGLGALLEEPAPASGEPPRRWIAVPGGPPASAELLGPAAGRSPALFLVGPEGGFTPGEVALAGAHGCAPLGLPTPVLRAPTAVALLAALGVLLS